MITDQCTFQPAIDEVTLCIICIIESYLPKLPSQVLHHHITCTRRRPSASFHDCAYIAHHSLCSFFLPVERCQKAKSCRRQPRFPSYTSTTSIASCLKSTNQAQQIQSRPPNLLGSSIQSGINGLHSRVLRAQVRSASLPSYIKLRWNDEVQ